MILDSLLNQQSANTGLPGPFRPVFKWKGQNQGRASVFKARCQPSVDPLHGTLSVISHTFLEGRTTPGGRKRELYSGLTITLGRCKRGQCMETTLLHDFGSYSLLLWWHYEYKEGDCCFSVYNCIWFIVIIFYTSSCGSDGRLQTTDYRIDWLV